MTPDSRGDSALPVRTVGERVEQRIRQRREAAAKTPRRRRPDPSHPGALPPSLQDKVGLAGRIAAFGVAIVAGYILFRQLTYAIFAPELEVIRPIVPEAGITAGEPVTMGVLVRNGGPISGASFVVAVAGDVELEGPTLDVPAGDSALIPVRLSLNSGLNDVSLVVFDGWRGVRRLESYRNLSVTVKPRLFDVHVLEQAERGDALKVAVPWSNLGVSAETVTPVVVFRPVGGGAPLDEEGPAFELAPGEARTLEFEIDTWPLEAGRYSMDVFLEAPGRERVAQGRFPHSLEVTQP